MRLLVSMSIAVSAWAAQGGSGLTARELYFREEGAPAKPAVKPVKPPPVQKQAARKQADPVVQAASKPPVETAPRTPSGVPVVQAAMHLGVRYNVLRVTDREKKTREAVDPDIPFRAGECVAIEIEPNRAGHLYVFNLGSSGAWQPLLPSPEMPGEKNRVASGKPMIVPEGHCFEFDKTPGTERLLVVVTERPEDMRTLGEAMKERMNETAPSGPAKSEVMLAGGRLPQELAFLRNAQMIGRDIRIAKVGAPQAAGEKPNAVYAVKTSTAANDRLVIEIALRHD